jgi:hypothetical protein
MKLTISTPKGKNMGTLDLQPQDTFLQLKQQFQRNSRLSIHRQGFKLQVGDSLKVCLKTHMSFLSMLL